MYVRVHILHNDIRILQNDVATYIVGMQQYYNISIYCNIHYCNTIRI